MAEWIKNKTKLYIAYRKITLCLSSSIVYEGMEEDTPYKW